MSPIVTILIAILGSGGFSAIVAGVVNYIVAKKLNKEAKETAVSEGVKLLLEERIDRVAKRNIEQGFIYEDDKSRLIRMWKVYHEQLGGNGYLDTIMSIMMNLEVKVRKM